MSQISIIRETNVIRGIVVASLVTLVSYVIISIIWNYEFVGFYLLADIEFALGTIFGVITTLNKRQEDQRILLTGAIVGVIGGVLASALIGFYQMIIIAIVYAPDMYVFIFYFGTHLISGIVIGLIGGALSGTYYMYKEVKGESKEEETEDDFFADLMEK